jgi:hypothetical protein
MDLASKLKTALNLCYSITKMDAAANTQLTFLAGYTGYLQVDEYACDEQTKATLVGCLTKTRHQLVEAKQT